MIESIVVVSLTDLRALIAAAVEAAIARRADEPSEWLDAEGVAALLGVHARTVQKLVKRSGLPAHRLGAKLYRYRRTEVLAWIATRGTDRAP